MLSHVTSRPRVKRYAPSLGICIHRDGDPVTVLQNAARHAFWKHPESFLTKLMRDQLLPPQGSMRQKLEKLI